MQSTQTRRSYQDDHNTTGQSQRMKNIFEGETRRPNPGAADRNPQATFFTEANDEGPRFGEHTNNNGDRNRKQCNILLTGEIQHGSKCIGEHTDNIVDKDRIQCDILSTG